MGYQFKVLIDLTSGLPTAGISVDLPLDVLSFNRIEVNQN